MNDESIGALWAKKSIKGSDYFTGSITIEGKKYPIVCFYNGAKTKDTQPDYRILLSKPREAVAQKDNAEELNNLGSEVPEDEIPF